MTPNRLFEFAVPENYEWALPESDCDYDSFRRFGQPQGTAWHPVAMKLLRQDDHGRTQQFADLPWFGEHVLILRPSAVRALGDLCREAGELLPLTCQDAELMAWNVTNAIDALDFEKSKVVRFPTSGRVMKVTEHVFRPHRVQGCHAFRVPELNTIYVDEEFTARVRDAKLTGTSFRQVWALS